MARLHQDTSSMDDPLKSGSALRPRPCAWSAVARFPTAAGLLCAMLLLCAVAAPIDKAKASEKLTDFEIWFEIKGKNVAIFVEGNGNCCIKNMQIIRNYLRHKNFVIIDKSWRGWIHPEKAGGFTISELGKGDFVRFGLTRFTRLAKYNNVYIFAHSWGADSVVRLIQRSIDTSEQKLNIRLFAVIDPVGSGGVRRTFKYHVLPSSIKYFYNRWQTNKSTRYSQKFKLLIGDIKSFSDWGDFVPMDGSLVKGDMVCPVGTVCDQQARTYRRYADGKIKDRLCEWYEIGCRERRYSIFPSRRHPGFVRQKVFHTDLPEDDLIQKELIDIVNELTKTERAPEAQAALPPEQQPRCAAPRQEMLRAERIYGARGHGNVFDWLQACRDVDHLNRFVGHCFSTPRNVDCSTAQAAVDDHIQRINDQQACTHRRDDYQRLASHTHQAPSFAEQKLACQWIVDLLEYDPIPNCELPSDTPPSCHQMGELQERVSAYWDRAGSAGPNFWDPEVTQTTGEQEERIRRHVEEMQRQREAVGPTPSGGFDAGRYFNQ